MKQHILQEYETSGMSTETQK